MDERDASGADVVALDVGRVDHHLVVVVDQVVARARVPAPAPLTETPTALCVTSLSARVTAVEFDEYSPHALLSRSRPLLKVTVDDARRRRHRRRAVGVAALDDEWVRPTSWTLTSLTVKGTAAPPSTTAVSDGYDVNVIGAPGAPERRMTKGG